jgi:hypothetical protein
MGGHGKLQVASGEVIPSVVGSQAQREMPPALVVSTRYMKTGLHKLLIWMQPAMKIFQMDPADQAL